MSLQHSRIGHTVIYATLFGSELFLVDFALIVSQYHCILLILTVLESN